MTRKTNNMKKKTKEQLSYNKKMRIRSQNQCLPRTRLWGEFIQEKHWEMKGQSKFRDPNNDLEGSGQKKKFGSTLERGKQLEIGFRINQSLHVLEIVKNIIKKSLKKKIKTLIMRQIYVKFEIDLGIEE